MPLSLSQDISDLPAWAVNMDDVPVFNDYDAAVQIQNTEVSRLHGSQMELTLQ